MRDFIVRLSQAEDLPQVDELLMRSYPVLLKPDYPASVLVTAIPRMARANPTLLSSGSYYVAEDDDGLIIGCGGWSFADPNSGRRRRKHGHVRHFGTDPGVARCGVARAIMQQSFTDARSSNVRMLECYSTRTAMPFYRAQGFKKIRDMVVPLAPGIEFPAILMTRNI